jgi:hypothetical protein
VTIEVGEDKAKFHVHKTFLCDVSAFFKAALNAGFKESGSQKVELPEDTTETFELFLSWLYTQEYKGMDEKLFKKPETANRVELERFMDLFIFADKVGAQGLKRQMVNKHFRVCKKEGVYAVPGIQTVTELYKRTTQTCALRRLWIAMHVWSRDHDSTDVEAGFREYREAAMKCPELAADLICGLLTKAQRATSSPFAGVAKDFYEPAMLEK